MDARNYAGIHRRTQIGATIVALVSLAIGVVGCVHPPHLF